MKRVSIRGTIVDAWFDAPFFAAEIDSGIITPVSRFRAALDAALAADDSDGVEIEINSVGGDVFAGGEILALIQDAGEKIARVSIGAIAASMAANIAIMAARPLVVHSNTLIYFHSAKSEIFGGPGAHEDEADLLARINAPMIARLVAAGVAPERVNRGFEEGRSLVFGADEAAEFFGADVVGVAAPAPNRPDAETLAKIERGDTGLDRLADYTATMRRVARLAAWTPDAPAMDAEPPAPVDETEPEPAETAKQESPAPEARAALESLEKQLRAVQSGAAKKISSLTARVQSLETERNSAMAELADLKKRAETLAASLEHERTARAALVGDVVSPETDTETPSAFPFSDRLAALRSVDERLEFAREHSAVLSRERARMAMTNNKNN